MLLRPRDAAHYLGLTYQDFRAKADRNPPACVQSSPKKMRRYRTEDLDRWQLGCDTYGLAPPDAITEPDLDQIADEGLARDRLQRAMDALPARELRVLQMRFGFNNQQPMTREDIGRTLDLTRERVQQIEYRALDRLKAALTHIIEYTREPTRPAPQPHWDQPRMSYQDASGGITVYFPESAEDVERFYAELRERAAQRLAMSSDAPGYTPTTTDKEP